MSERKVAVITHGKDGGYVATFPDREPATDRFASILAQHCIIIGYSVKYEIQEHELSGWVSRSDGKGKMKHCVAHHRACDCREQMFAEMAAENKTLKHRLEYANGKLSEAVVKMDELRDIIRKPNAQADRTAKAGERGWS